MSDTAGALSSQADRVRGAAPRASAWSRAVLALIAAVLIVTAVYWSTALSIVSIWVRSETFAHGFLIVPISLWLMWEKRAGLRRLQPEPTFAPVTLFLPLGMLWLMGHLVDTLVVQQYAYVGMLIVAIWASVGHRTARYLAFPIGFLLLAVPVGEGLIYPMMNFTADFTVGMLKLTGIPVYREGIFFTIPSGNWSVVEACSGVRYLIASVTLGFLFAYLTYSKWWKRALFLLVSIVVPIVANGLRAYMIVMIGHLSDMKLAVGVDHLLYGWVFFGIVVTIMFLVGSIWRDPPQELPVPDLTSRPHTRASGTLTVLAAIGISAAIWPALSWALADDGRDVENVIVNPPEAMSGWRFLAGAPWDWQPRVVGADGQQRVFYQREGQGDATVAGLYLSVYRQQRQGSELVSSSNVMVPQEHPMWSDIAVVPMKLQLQHRRLSVEQHFLVSREGQRLLVWTWYRVAGRHMANPYAAKMLEAISRIVGSRGEGALIAVAAPYDERPEVAHEALEAFIDAMLPAIDAEIDRAVNK
jgi:exosortase A